jgi:hypothetical protein
MTHDGQLDAHGMIEVFIRQREPAICGYSVVLQNHYGAGVSFSLGPEEFLELLQWGEEHRELLEDLAKDE